LFRLARSLVKSGKRCRQLKLVDERFNDCRGVRGVHYQDRALEQPHGPELVAERGFQKCRAEIFGDLRD